jgi:hypothetical protein
MRRGGLLLGIVALLLTLTSCGTVTGAPPSSAGMTSPVSSSSAPASPDPRPTPASSKGPARNAPKPVLPDAARQNTAEGFEAFTQYWFDTITYGLETGDGEPLRLISLPDCKMCNNYIADADKVARGEVRHVGPRWTISAFEPNMILDPYRRAMGYFFLDESPSQEYGSAGELLKDRAPTLDRDPKVIHATFEEGQWFAAEAGQM